MSISENTRLGRYEIRSQIGKGGMGEVYQALDTELDRTVAIKILPTEVASDQQRLQRFIQEAKAASALNHPHILTVYEIGTIGDSRYIATEFIEGDTLRRRIAAGIKLEEILEISIQVTSALAAAHAAGIVHRDIKPENVMVRHDGYAKVLDFGLAKLAQPAGTTTDTEAPTKTLVNTDAGTVMGTANYMSPEQAKGTHLDARSDLWSVGALLYEMVTKHLPFAGETPTETISLILQKEPAPLLRYANNVPAELERIVTKALTKDPEGRYQTAKDLLIDLRNLKRKLEVDAEIDRTVPPEILAATSTAGGSPAHSTVSNPSIAGTSAPSSAEYIVSGIRHHKLAAVVGLLVLLVAVGIGLVLYLRNSSTATDSIAVLPFVNVGGDQNLEYLSDGISETLINSLTQIQRLHVTARASAFRYKGKEVDPQTIGRELNVRTVLMGRVRQSGDMVNVQVDLVDATTGAQLWGEEYERKLADVLSVKQAISREITDKLRLRISGAEQNQLLSGDSNGEAYQLYLKGRYHWSKRTCEALEKSNEYFNQAIEKDPNYALAYAGLADSCFTIAWYRCKDPKEGYEKARAAAQKALSIDDKLPEAHNTLAEIKGNYEWDWPGAEKEFKLAIQLNPNYPTAHQSYSLYLPVVGRFDESVAEAKRAQELDPLSLILNENVGDMLYLARRYDEAEAQLLKTLELDPNFFVAQGTLAKIYEAKGMYKEALELGLRGESPEDAARVRKIYAASGIKGIWRARLEYLLERSKREHVSPFTIATLYTRLDEKDKAFEWLEKALEARGILFTYLVTDPRFDNIRSDPRYIALLARANLKPIQMPR
jgi:serine/threonine protein kinase/tetratricopeptide (TPR) repeat protein